MKYIYRSLIILLFSIQIFSYLLASPKLSLAISPTIDSLVVTKDLYQGITDLQVIILQKILNLDPETRVAITGGGSPGNETAYFGALTTKAVKALQFKRGIKPVGNTGPLTRAALDLQVINYSSSESIIKNIQQQPTITGSSTAVSLSTSLNSPISFVLPKIGTKTTSAVVTPNVFNRSLFIGSTGNDILYLQRILNTSTTTRVADTGLGSPGNETTYFGPATQVALRKFQCIKMMICSGTPETTGYGVANKKTLSLLNDTIASNSISIIPDSNYVIYSKPINGGVINFVSSTADNLSLKYVPASGYSGIDSFIIAQQSNGINNSFIKFNVTISGSQASNSAASYSGSSGGGGGGGGGGSPTLTVPGIPNSVTAIAGNAEATVNFTAPTSDGGSSVTGYNVISNPAGGVDSNSGTTALTHTITGLTNGTQYTFTVTATNAIGTGIASASSNSVTPNTTNPPLITALSVSAVTSTTTIITWTTDVPSTSQIDYGTTTLYGISTLLDSSLATSHSVTVTNLTASTTYHYIAKSKSGANILGTSADNIMTTDYALVWATYTSFTNNFPVGNASTTYVQNPSDVVINVPESQDSTITAPASMTSGYDGATVEFWMKNGRSLNGNNNPIIIAPGLQVYPNGSGPYGALYFYYSHAYNGVHSGDVSAYYYLRSTDNQWHYYAYSYDKRFARLYVDGQLVEQEYVDSVTTKIGPMLYTNGNNSVPLVNPTQITAGNSSAQLAFGTPVANRRLTLSVLTPLQIQQNYERGHGYTTVYASPTGSGNGTSIGSPKSLANAVSTLTTNTRLVLLPGEYNGGDFNIITSGASSRDNILIMGLESTSTPVVIRNGAPTLTGANYITLQNLTFVTSTTTALTINNSVGVKLDALRIAGGSNGIVLTNSATTTLQNSTINVPLIGASFVTSPGAVIRNNTIVNGTIGLSFSSASGQMAIFNNLISGQSVESLLVNDSASNSYYLGDANIYNPNSSVAVAVVSDTYTPAQVINKNLSRAWSDYNIISKGLDSATGGKLVSIAPEAKSTSIIPQFISTTTADYRLDPNATSTPIDGGVDTIKSYIAGQWSNLEPPPYDQTGAARATNFDGYGYIKYTGNAVDIGAFETAPNRSSTFTVSLVGGTANASAGVYTKASSTDSQYLKLVRTLYSGKKLTNSSETIYWNGLDDLNRPLSDATTTGGYKIKILSNNLQYNWDGVIGNSASQNSPTTGWMYSGPHLGFAGMAAMAFGATTTIYTSGYNEGDPGLFRVATNDPNKVLQLFGDGSNGHNIYANDLTTDGTYLYMIAPNYTDGGCESEKYDFVTGGVTGSYTNSVLRNTNPRGGQGASYIRFSSGVCDGTVESRIAVQGSVGNNLLLAGVKNDNLIYRFDKTTGDPASGGASFSVSGPGAMVISTSTGGLWVVSASTTVNYYTNLNNATPTKSNFISGFTWATAVALYGNTLLVGDSGTHQITAWDINATSTPLWTFGMSGGYANGPTVSTTTDGNDTHFKFDVFKYITFQPDGTFWVGDINLARSLRFDMSRNLLDMISFAGARYTASVDPTDSTAFFNGIIQYKMDYNYTLNPTSSTSPRGWQYDKYWGYNVASLPSNCGTKPEFYYGSGGSFGIQNVVTLSNGQRYGRLQQCLVRLDPTTGLQYVSQAFGFFAPLTFIINPDGSYYGNGDTYGQDTFSTGNTGISGSGDTIQFSPLKRTLTGFTGNTPNWSSTVSVMATVPVKKGAGRNSLGWFNSDPYPGSTGGGTYPAWNGKNIIVTNRNSIGTGEQNGYRLGAIAPNGTDWLWETNLAYGQLNGRGSYDTFSEYGGNIVETLNDDIISGYHGEFFHGVGQAGIFFHYHNSGLFLGQIGGNAYNPFGSPFAPASSGNNTATTLVTNGSTLYIYSNSEQAGRGSQRWSITGTSTEVLQAGTVLP